MATRKAKAAAAEASFGDILKTAWKNLPVDPILPKGSYRFSLTSAMQKPASENTSEQVIIFLKALEALDDVDEEDLQELADQKVEIGAAKPTITVFISGASSYRKVGKVLEVAGIDDKVPNMAELAEVKNAKGTLIGQVIHYNYKDKDTGEEKTGMRIVNIAKDE